MKLKKPNYINNKILKLHFIKSNLNSLTDKTKTSNTNNYQKYISTLKKILKIIYIYNNKNKRILFVNPPKNLEQIIKKQSTHLIKTTNYKQNTSLNYNRKYIKNTTNSTKPDLIVILSKETSSSNSGIYKSYWKTTPTINLTNTNAELSIYKLKLNNTRGNFIFNLINSIIKK